MKFGRIVGVLVILLALAGIGAGTWYWSTHNSHASSAPVLGSGESDSVLSARAVVLSDSLQVLDMAIRSAQQSDSEPPVELIRKQNEMWARYTWAKSRLSDAMDARKDTTAVAGGAKLLPVSMAGDAAGLGAALGSLAIYLWVLAGVVVLFVVVLAWWLLGRRPQASRAPLTEPTMTRVDRNVRMPIPGTPTGRNVPPPREATFSQLRAAARLSPEMDDEVAQRPGGRTVRETAPEPEIPAAPLPKTGRHAWENTTSQPQNNLPSPSEPTVVQDYVVSMAKRGRTSSEIARRLRVPQDQVDLILKLRRNG